jgi:hypothetical protein
MQQENTVVKSGHGALSPFSKNALLSTHPDTGNG